MESDKETSEQRRARYVTEFLRECNRIGAEKVNGQASLTINFNAGLPRSRTIEVTETKS